jgi:hypothetical protein
MNPVARGALAADPSIGAGNVLQTLLDRGADPDGPGLGFDTAVEHHPAEKLLTLGELDERVAARAAALPPLTTFCPFSRSPGWARSPRW